MSLVSYIQQYFNTSISVLTNQVWVLLIALFKVPNTGAFTVLNTGAFMVYSKSREDAFHFRKRQAAISHCHKRALFHIFSWVLHAMNYKRIGMPHGALGLYMFDFFFYLCVCMSVSLYMCVYISVYSVVHCTGIDRIDFKQNLYSSM